MAHTSNGIGVAQIATPEMAARVRALLNRAAIANRVDLRTWVATGNLPGAATITSLQFARALAAIGAGIVFTGEADDSAGDTG